MAQPSGAEGPRHRRVVDVKKPKSKPRRAQKSRKRNPAAASSARAGQVVHRLVAEPARKLSPGAPARAAALSLASAYPSDDRAALGLLLLPFVIVALSLGFSQALKPTPRWLPAMAELPALGRPAGPRPQATARAPEPAPVLAPATPLSYPPQPPSLPALALELPGRLAAYPPPAPVIDVAALSAPPVPAPEIELPGRMAAWPPPAPAIDAPAAAGQRERLASLAPISPPVAIEPAVPTLPAPPVPPADASAEQVCRPTVPMRVSRARSGPRLAQHVAASPEAFGMALAAAAKAQTEEFVIYTARYQRIVYPLGDLAPMHGACTDVVIRAYRSLGVDLQELVQRANVGSGDPSIDHRRTETLRRFFRTHGEMLALSELPEDYKPGDIVTYYRPFSRVSRSHIAVVSDVIAPTGRPMIIHNRGYGPQLEDALFVDRITGHYRYAGPPVAIAVAGRESPVAGAAPPAIKRKTVGMPLEVK
jgi:hypothetical protein